ncbi:protocatechuate 3,4-dioxygenase subunit alpha [Phytoactinopolyspora mesophila]|uniref:Protocatechuate 3,4-dioxygenase subunit alpha n=1 Tax=Phytoactinopolyspora mesophila TaxID=2650750 RepID=A0A7K3M1X9_9ACTN|nr:protocatechuate 3,4-dioxygenase subunit alpha [Phytoactinopolyspora mesophila]NDL56428.1 protocatechuate 3,4-dioxygenase subunit alpha [Phytoactinopolyspora mesophila]
MSEATRMLPATPGQTIGPFFHYALPYERDHELVPPATPGAIRLHGTVYDGDGSPVPDAMLEIRQADPTGTIPEVEGSLRRDGTVFTGWGRADTDTAGRYSFTTVEPGPTRGSGAPFFSIVVFARGLTNRLFTRAYLPGTDVDDDATLAHLDPAERQSMLTVRQSDGSLRFDVHLQGPRETVFLTFPGHQA